MALNFPNQHELLESIVEFLKQEVQPLVEDPAVAYRLKVAMNSLAIAGREAEQSAHLEALEQAELSALLNRKASTDVLNRELAEALKNDRVDAAQPNVLASLKAITLAKMAIDNPRYSTYRAMQNTPEQ